MNKRITDLDPLVAALTGSESFEIDLTGWSDSLSIPLDSIKTYIKEDIPLPYVTLGGVTADYPATSVANGLKQALTDGHLVFKALADFNIYDSILLPVNVKIDLNGFRMTMIGDNTIELTSIILETGGLSFAFTTTNYLFNATKTIFNNLDIVNSSSVASTYLVYNPVDGSAINNSKITLPNKNYGITRADMGIVMNNTEIVGGGTACSLSLTNSNYISTNLKLTGTFNTTYSAGAGVIYQANILGLITSSAMSINSLKGRYIQAENAFVLANSYCHIQDFTLSHFRKASNSFFKDGEFTTAASCNTGDMTNTVFENITFTGNLVIDALATNLTFINCTFTGTLTNNGDYNAFRGCKTKTTVNSGDYNTFDNHTIDVSAGGSFTNNNLSTTYKQDINVI